MKLLTVIPASAAYGEPARTQGTKVVDQEGNEIEGVTRIELVAEVDDVWRATIACCAQVKGPIYAETKVIDVTNLSDAAQRQMREQKASLESSIAIIEKLDTATEDNPVIARARAEIERLSTALQQIGEASTKLSPAKRLALKLGKDRLEHFHAVEEARLNADIANAGLKWKPTAWYRRVWRRVRDAL